MVVFILSFRSQNVAIREASYQSALNDYTDSIKMLLERPELGPLMDEMGRAMMEPGEDAATISETDRASFAYMLLNYSLFERIYLLYEKKWIDEDTWSQWLTWMKGMAKHRMFQEVHKRSQGTFDKGFQDLVEGAMNR